MNKSVEASRLRLNVWNKGAGDLLENVDPEDYKPRDLLSWSLGYEQPAQAIEAEKAAREAIHLNPSYAAGYYHLGRALLLQGRYEDARKAFEHAAELGDVRYRDLGVAQVNLAQANYDAAVALLLKNGEPKAANDLYYLSAAYAAKGDKEKALAALEKTLKRGYRDFAAIDASPYFASLRSDPRFQRLIRQYRK